MHLRIQDDRRRHGAEQEPQAEALPASQSPAPLRLPDPPPLSSEQRSELLRRVGNSPSTISAADRQALRRECREGRLTEEQNEGLRSNVAPQLIAALGADSFRIRDDASAALLSIGIAGRSALETAVRSNDPEVSRRASNLLGRIAEEHGANLARRIILADDESASRAVRESIQLRRPHVPNPGDNGASEFMETARRSFEVAFPNHLANALVDGTAPEIRERATTILRGGRTEGQQVQYLSTIAENHGNANAAAAALQRTNTILSEYLSPDTSREQRQRLIERDLSRIPTAVLEEGLSIVAPNNVLRLMEQIKSEIDQNRDLRGMQMNWGVVVPPGLLPERR